jgi:hypothetical protein
MCVALPLCPRSSTSHPFVFVLAEIEYRQKDAIFYMMFLVVGCCVPPLTSLPL